MDSPLYAIGETTVQTVGESIPKKTKCVPSVRKIMDTFFGCLCYSAYRLSGKRQNSHWRVLWSIAEAIEGFH